MYGFCRSRDCKDTFSIGEDGEVDRRKDLSYFTSGIGSLTSVDIQVFQEMKDGNLKYVNLHFSPLLQYVVNS